MADLYTPRLHRRVVRPPGNTRSASIYEQLRSALLSGQYLPGTWLREEQLAAEYAASRTPVREALRRLESDGLVEIVPRRGVLVVDLALEDLDEVYDIRSALETLAATPFTETVMGSVPETIPLTRAGDWFVRSPFAGLSIVIAGATPRITVTSSVPLLIVAGLLLFASSAMATHRW